MPSRPRILQQVQSTAGDRPGATRDAGAVVTHPASSASFALFILFAINLLNFFDRQLPGALAEPIRREFHLSDTALGLLATVVTLMYGMGGLPLGRLADKWYRTRLLAIGTAVWSLLTAASGLAQTYMQLFASGWGWVDV